MAAVMSGAAALECKELVLNQFSHDHDHQFSPFSDRKAVAKTRDRAKDAGTLPPWLAEIIAELPEDNTDAAPNEIKESVHHRSRRLLKKSKHPYDRISWFVLQHFTSKAWFEAFVMANILLVGAATGVELDNDGRDKRISEAVNAVSLFTLAVFTLEVVLKVVAEAREPWRYLTDADNGSFNLFDLSIVVASYAFLGQGGGAVGGLRMLRLVRLLTFVKNVPQLRVIVAGLVQGMRSMAIICILLGLIIYMFAILACLLFGENDPANFGTVGSGMLTLFQVSTLAGWTNIAYVAWYGCENYLGSAYGEDLPSKISTLTGEFEGLKCNKVASSLSPVSAAFFYSIYILITSWVVMSLFIGVISMGMFEAYVAMKEEERQLRKDKRLEENSRLYRTNEVALPLKEKIDVVLDDDAFVADPVKTSFDRVELAAKTLRDSGYFNLLITVTIIIIGVMIGVDTDDGLNCSRLRSRLDDPHANCDPRLATVVIGWIAQAIFTVEVMIKLVAEGRTPLHYFVDKENGSWNCLDFFVVVVGFVEETPAGRKIFEDFPVVILRLLRLIRVFRLAKALPRLRSIVEALISGFSAVGWIFVLIVLFNYIAACVCMTIFRRNDPFHFGSLGRSMFTMLRLETMDNWEDILYLTVFGCSNYPAYDYTAENPNMNCKESESYGFGWVGASIICSIVIFGAYVLPTVLIGVVSIKFDEATRYADTARHLKKHTKPLIEQAQQHLPDFFSKARILACRSLFDQMDTDSSLTLEYVALAPFYHYSFAKLFNVEITPDQCESIFQIMDTDRNANVSFDEFLVFVSTLKKLEKRCADNQEYKEFNFGYESFQGVKNDNEHSVWNRAMTRANHESVKLAWDNLFAALNGGNGTSMEEKVYILYNAFDSDNSGDMDEEELTTGLKECGCHMTATQVHAFIMAVDENGDGQLSFEEFFQLIKNEEAKRETEKREREQLEVETLLRRHKSLGSRVLELLLNDSDNDDGDGKEDGNDHDGNYDRFGHNDQKEDDGPSDVAFDRSAPAPFAQGLAAPPRRSAPCAPPSPGRLAARHASSLERKPLSLGDMMSRDEDMIRNLVFPIDEDDGSLPRNPSSTPPTTPPRRVRWLGNQEEGASTTL